MEKLSASMSAQYQGRAQALHTLGFAEDQIKVAFVQDGLSSEVAEYLLKEAGIGKAIGGALRWGSKLFGSGAGKLTQGARAARKAVPMGPIQKTRLDRVKDWGAGKMMGARKATMETARGMETKPWSTVGGGMKNFGSGAMFAQGEGIGGTLGKGVFGANMASTFLPSSSPQEYQPQYQPQYQNYPQYPRLGIATGGY